MFTWQMQRQPFEEVAILPVPGAVSALGRERKMLSTLGNGKILAGYRIY